MTTFDADVTPDIERMLARHAPERWTPPRLARSPIAGEQGRIGGADIVLGAARQYFTSAWRHRRPGMLVRGLAVLLAEPAMRVGNPETRLMLPDGEPTWLARYRPLGVPTRESLTRWRPGPRSAW